VAEPHYAKKFGALNVRALDMISIHAVKEEVTVAVTSQILQRLGHMMMPLRLVFVE
jgi:hypothetical protein